MNSEKKRGNNISGEEEYHSRPWADLDDNLLLDIFRRLSIKELFLVVSLVCRSWRSVCWDVLFWKDEETLDLTNLRPFLYPDFPKKSWKITSNALKSAVDPAALDFNQRSIKTIIFYRTSWSFPCHDFTFLAERSPGLKRLIMNCPNPANLNFLPVLRSWKHKETNAKSTQVCDRSSCIRSQAKAELYPTTLSFQGFNFNDNLFK
ncbi:F-box/LRR-repeat protein [Morus notabilis]|uniref:F-box/LRR-repeat protein n=1 Tax=Morus notabilis TaxID=981085 RepID=W9S201_9ROSA|nr:F-box/LRR-repeat protein [Morus notabilis]